MLSRWVHEKRRNVEELKIALEAANRYLLTAGPRKLGPRSLEAPVLVFTDGACEDSAPIGGVMMDGERVEYFGAVMGKFVVESWRSRMDQQQVIGQAELYPVLVARWTWRKELSGRKVIFMIDNESARLGLVKACSPVLPSLRIIVACHQWDIDHELTPWYSREPTEANISDGPSRMRGLDVVAGRRAIRVDPVFEDGTRPDGVL